MTLQAMIIAAALAGGPAGGGGQLPQHEIDKASPAIKTYVSKASIQAVTDVLDDKLIKVRAGQLEMLADDIAEDLSDGESAKLSDLIKVMRAKVRTDDPLWRVWYDQNFAVYIQWQVDTAADKTIPVDLAEVVKTMKLVANKYIPASNAAELAESEARTAAAIEEADRRRAEKQR